jgi:anti-sigma factor RsiW
MQMHALADDELDDQAKATAAELAQKDPACHAEYQAVQSLKSLLKTHCCCTPPPSLWNQTVKRLDAIDRTRKAESFVGRYAWALCGVFLIMIVGAATTNRLAAKRSVHAGDMAEMASSLSPLALPSGSAPKVVHDMVSSVLGDAPVNAEPVDLTLRSVAEGLIDGFRVARLTFGDQKGTVALIIVKNADEVHGVQEDHQADGYRVGKLNSLHVVSWIDGGYALFVVGQRSADELCRVADALRAGR